MSYALFYVIVRYRPLASTREFANIGVVVLDPREQSISYRVAPKRFRRVTQFFDNVPAAVYAEAIGIVIDDLARLQERLAKQPNDEALTLFTSFAKRREGVIAFGNIHGVTGSDPAETASRLYARFVRRSDDTELPREFALTKAVRQALRNARITSFRARQIDDDMMPVKLPLVSGKIDTFVIKPIAFEQKSTLAIIDHANVWRDRFLYLIAKGRLERDNVLILVDGSDPGEDDLIREAHDIAYRTIMSIDTRLDRYDADIGPSDSLIDFATRGAEPMQRRYFN